MANNTNERRGEEMADEDMATATPLDSERKRLADRLRETREFLGLSQQEAATAANLTRLALSSIETGRRRVESVELQALARVYRQPVTYFLEPHDTEAGSEDLRFIARAAKELSPDDRSELLKFAEFLRRYKAPAPQRTDET
jgi:transcriptional regulator with XRE-family HTH domain